VKLYEYLQTTAIELHGARHFLFAHSHGSNLRCRRCRDMQRVVLVDVGRMCRSMSWTFLDDQNVV
jgi:hypothetical protein